VWEKALMYFRQAGEKAMTRSAHREAVEYFEQALSALSYMPEQRDTREQAIDLRLALRSALAPLGDYGRILAALREAEALAEALDDPRRLARVSSFLSFDFCRRGLYDQAIAAARRALALATARGEVILQAEANNFLCRVHYHQGNYCRAITAAEQVVAAIEGTRHSERFGVFLPAVHSRAWLASCHAELGTFAEGRALGKEGLRIAEAVAHPASLMLAYNGLGLLALRHGDLPRALPLLERVIGICQDTGLTALYPLIAEPLGAAYTLGGRVADALPLLTQALEQLMSMDRVDFQARCHLSLGEAHML
jgi:tetratricopeptide (TPR) repeat protein